MFVLASSCLRVCELCRFQQLPCICMDCGAANACDGGNEVVLLAHMLLISLTSTTSLPLLQHIWRYKFMIAQAARLNSELFDIESRALT